MKSKFINILFLIIWAFASFAQENRTDFQTWYGAKLKLNLKKGWTATGQYRLRMVDNSSVYRGSYVFGQVDKKINKHIELTANYRLAMISNAGVYNRYAFGIDAKQKFRHFQVALRPMLQYQKQHFTGDDEGKIDTDTYFRQRISTKYSFTKKLDVYVYAEPFFKIDNSWNLDWWQNSAGVQYEFLKNKKVNFYYIWQPDYSHKNYLQTNHILGIDLEFTIKP